MHCSCVESGFAVTFHPSRQSHSRKALAIGIASLYLVAAGSFSLHLATVSHVVCAEHGELAHPQGSQATHDHDSQAQAKRTVIAERTSDASPSIHDHCKMVQHCAGDATEIGFHASVLGCTPGADGLPWPIATAAYPGVKPTSVAPKQSPPAA
jgi:hypothetical protein